MYGVAVLGADAIKELIENRSLISDYIDMDRQLQGAGFDLTVGEIEIISETQENRGYIDFSNRKRKLPELNTLDTGDMCWNIEKGGYYLVRVNEVIKLPPFLIAEFRPRSSLMRMGGDIVSAWVDPGYHGRLQFGLVAYSSFIVEKNARVAQIIFIKTDTYKLYEGRYQNEGLIDEIR